MKCVFNLVWNLLLKYSYLEGQDINRTALSKGHYDFVFQPTISPNTIGEKIFSIISSSKVAIQNFSHFFFPFCWPVFRIHIILFE